MTAARRAIGFTAQVDHAKVVIAAEDGDGFLQRSSRPAVSPLEFNAGLMLSSDRGLDIGLSVGDGALAVLCRAQRRSAGPSVRYASNRSHATCVRSRRIAAPARR